jgi:hypothetical protein
MIEVNGLLNPCIVIPDSAPAAQGGARHLREMGCVRLVVINTACVHLLCFVYSLFVGSRRNSPRLFSSCTE